MAILLTETAAKEIKNIIRDQGLPEAVALRVGVKGGGGAPGSATCSILPTLPPKMTK